MTGIIYKSNQRFSALPSCCFDIEFCKRLYSAIAEKSAEAAEIEVGLLTRNPSQTEDDFNNLKEYARNLYKVTIQIIGSQGEFITSESTDVFKDENLPDQINSIIYDNSIKYNFELKKDPLNKIRVCFDFRKAPIFDLITSPSLPASNENIINVVGQNETWVDGAYRKVVESLKGKSNRRGWLHQRNVYDLLMWLVFIPISFWIIYRIGGIFKHYNFDMSPVFVVFAYLYFFLFITNVFRVMFNYARWVFPYNEIEGRQSSGSLIHRVILFSLFLSILASVLYDVIKLIIHTAVKA
jgi:hypothetical protein